MEPVRLIRRPVEVEGLQWTGDNKAEMMAFVGDYGRVDGEYIQLSTTKGLRTARPGSWILKESWSNYYMCSPRILEKAYEPYEEGVEYRGLSRRLDEGPGIGDPSVVKPWEPPTKEVVPSTEPACFHTKQGTSLVADRLDPLLETLEQRKARMFGED